MVDTLNEKSINYINESYSDKSRCLGSKKFVQDGAWISWCSYSDNMPGAPSSYAVSALYYSASYGGLFYQDRSVNDRDFLNDYSNVWIAYAKVTNLVYSESAVTYFDLSLAYIDSKGEMMSCELISGRDSDYYDGRFGCVIAVEETYRLHSRIQPKK